MFFNIYIYINIIYINIYKITLIIFLEILRHVLLYIIYIISNFNLYSFYSILYKNIKWFLFLWLFFQVLKLYSIIYIYIYLNEIKLEKFLIFNLNIKKKDDT